MRRSFFHGRAVAPVINAGAAIVTALQSETRSVEVERWSRRRALARLDHCVAPRSLSARPRQGRAINRKHTIGVKIIENGKASLYVQALTTERSSP
jgi:hypothetical protein